MVSLLSTRQQFRFFCLLKNNSFSFFKKNSDRQTRESDHIDGQEREIRQTDMKQREIKEGGSVPPHIKP